MQATVFDFPVSRQSHSDVPVALGSSKVFPTGFQPLNTGFTTACTRTVSFGVVDMPRFNVRWSLAADPLQISALPKPLNAALSLLGLGALACERPGASVNLVAL